MHSSSNVKRLLIGALGGGLLSVVALFALMLLYAQISSVERPVVSILITAAVFVASSLGVLWATGFWGRWGMAIFFAILPVLLVIDFSLNPFFPFGVVLVAAICSSIGRGGNVRA